MESVNIYREKISEFYDRISAYVRTKPDIYGFIESKENEFSSPDVPREQSEMILFDWVIFDYKDAYGETLLDKFIRDTAPVWEDKVTYEGFKDNHFGLFHVKAVKAGKEAMLALLPDKKEFHIYDSNLTRDAKKGDVIVVRILAFRDIYVTTGPAFKYPESMADTMSVMFEGRDDEKKKFRFTPRIFFKAIESDSPKKEKKGDLRSRAKDLGIKEEKVDELLEKMRLASADKNVDPVKLLTDFISTAGNYREDRMEGLAAAYFDKWNAVVADEGSQKGPLEEMLIEGPLRDAVMKEVRPLEIEDEYERKVKVGEFTDKWLDTPHKALEGRTPKQAILKERESRGNTQKEVSYTLSFDIMIPDKAAQKAGKLIDEALELMKDKKYKQAIVKFIKCTEITSADHMVWYNMAMCYIYTKQEEACLSCLINSLNIKPDYEFAAKGLNNLANYASSGIKAKAKKAAKKYGIKINEKTE